MKICGVPDRRYKLLCMLKLLSCRSSAIHGQTRFLPNFGQSPHERAGVGKDTRHFELDLTGWGLSFEVGDSLAVYATNDPQLVDEIIHALGATGKEQVPRPKGDCRPHFAKRYCAITASRSQRPSF